MKIKIALYSLRPLTLALLSLAFLCSGIMVLKHCGYGLSYQVSSSMPKGWYVYQPIKQLHKGDWVSLKAPAFAEAYLQQHHLVPHSGVLIKAIAAVPGDVVCQRQGQLWINHRLAAVLLTKDRFQQAIPQRAFCQTLAKDQFLVLGLSDVRSYDSRYFGPINRQQILAMAKLL